MARPHDKLAFDLIMDKALTRPGSANVIVQASIGFSGKAVRKSLAFCRENNTPHERDGDVGGMLITALMGGALRPGADYNIEVEDWEA